MTISWKIIIQQFSYTQTWEVFSFSWLVVAALKTEVLLLGYSGFYPTLSFSSLRLQMWTPGYTRKTLSSNCLNLWWISKGYGTIPNQIMVNHSWLSFCFTPVKHCSGLISYFQCCENLTTNKKMFLSRSGSINPIVWYTQIPLLSLVLEVLSISESVQKYKEGI